MTDTQHDPYHDPYKADYRKARERTLESLTTALAVRYRELTGKDASNRLRDAIYAAVEENA